MSADNGIYILRSPTNLKTFKDMEVDYEYRVLHTQAIDNLFYTDKTYNDFPLGLFYEADYFRDCEVIYNIDEAFVKAGKLMLSILESDIEYIEYGIQLIKKDHVFPKLSRQYCKEALGY
jgi:hypothetical protein